MTKVKDLLLPAMGLLPLTAGAQGQATGSNDGGRAQRPNIIYIMCDDMGYADLGCYGQRRIDTPNLDRMAEEGMRFTQAYAGSPVSAPSRASFMTGQHTGHTHVRGNREYWRSAYRGNVFGNNGDYTIIGQEPYLMTHKIIPEVMKENGYTTGMFGKWAAGYYNMQYPDTYALDANGNTDTSKSGQSSSASLPNKRGIDCYYGYICQFQAHTYYPNFLNRYDPEKYGDKHVVVDTLKQNIQHASVSSNNKDYENREQYTSDLIHQYALEWIDRQDGEQPFFGIFTYTLPHAELWQPQDSLVEKYTKRFEGQDSNFGGDFGSWYYLNYGRHAQFAAMVERLDIQVGEIFAKLEEKGLADNVIEKKVRDGKTYFVVNDYEALRGLFAELLAEIQRIKSEGDYEAGKALVMKYAVDIDPELHKEVLERYAALDLKPYGGFLNPEIVPVEKDGKIVDYKIEYQDSYLGQMLQYGKKYSTL